MSVERALLLLFVFACLLPPLYGLIRFGRRLAGKRTSTWPLLVLLIGVALAFSVALDRAGVVQRARIVDKVDEVQVGRGYRLRRYWWRRELALVLDYEAGAAMNGAPASIECDAATFDAHDIGDTVEVRVLDLWVLLKFVRLKDESTLSAFIDFFPRTPRGPWQRSQAIVREITHITTIRLHGHHGRGAHDVNLRWPYDIVQLDFTPPGRSSRVTAVHVIEAASMPGLAAGDSVAITWPEDDPRSARIVGARDGSRWKNLFYDLGKWILLIAAVFVPLIYIRRRWKARALHR